MAESETKEESTSMYTADVTAVAIFSVMAVLIAVGVVVYVLYEPPPNTLHDLHKATQEEYELDKAAQKK